jgi:hypothetical protein
MPAFSARQEPRQGRCEVTQQSQNSYIVDQKGKRTGVVLPLRRYQKLIEDLHDLAVVAERARFSQEQPHLFFVPARRRA